MSTLPTFSIVIPTYNRSDVLERTIRQLDSQDYPADRFEVIAVDNSSDATPLMVERLAQSSRSSIRLLRVAQRLPAVKRNLGLYAATGTIVLFLNDDVWARPDLLSEHARAHAAHDGELVAVLGHVEQSPEMPKTPFLEFYRPFAYHEIAPYAERPVGPRHFWSMNLSLPRAEMIARNLVFHEDWAEIGHEDVELGHRWARAGGVVVYNARAYVEHYHPHTLESACALQESIGRGLRDLEKLVPERDLLERYGVFSWHNSPRAIVRGAIRRTLFNAVTVPYARRWLSARRRNTALTRWMYWKVMLHFTERGYRRAPTRHPRPVPIRFPETA
jgi:glycosyltransferase involved in cell wall biosynthesis